MKCGLMNDRTQKIYACLTRGGIAAAEDMRQAYIVKHIRKGLTILSSGGVGQCKIEMFLIEI